MSDVAIASAHARSVPDRGEPSGMGIELDCIPCFLRQALEAARFCSEDPRVHEGILRELLSLTGDLDLSRSPPFVGQHLHRRLRQLTGVADPYHKARAEFNRLATEALEEVRVAVRASADPLMSAATFAVMANAMDMGIPGLYGADEFRRALGAASEHPLIGDLESFREAIQKAPDLLYLADNAGEIVFDRLLIEEIGPERVTLVVRGAPILNDALLKDAREVGLEGLVEVLDNGSDAPGTLLEDCSPLFQERFSQATLVLAKGQGNFETLSRAPADIAFLFKVKCPVVARHVGLPLGSHVVRMHSGARSSS